MFCSVQLVASDVSESNWHFFLFVFFLAGTLLPEISGKKGKTQSLRVVIFRVKVLNLPHYSFGLFSWINCYPRVSDIKAAILKRLIFKYISLSPFFAYLFPADTQGCEYQRPIVLIFVNWSFLSVQTNPFSGGWRKQTRPKVWPSLERPTGLGRIFIRISRRFEGLLHRARRHH